MVSVREVSLMIVGSMVALVLNVIYNKSLEWLSKLEVLLAHFILKFDHCLIVLMSVVNLSLDLLFL